MMLVSTLSAQLELWSKLFDWYRDATPVSYSPSLIDLSPWPGDRLRYCTNTGSIPSKFNVPERLKQLKSCDDENGKSLYSPSFSIFFAQMQKFFPSVLRKKVHQVPVRMYSKSSQRKPAKHKKRSSDKILQRSSIVIWLQKIIWKQRRDVIASDKGLQPIEIVTPPVHNPLSGHGAIFSPSCFYLQQKFENPVSYRGRNSKVSIFTEYHVPNWFVSEGN